MAQEGRRLTKIYDRTRERVTRTKSQELGFNDMRKPIAYRNSLTSSTARASKLPPHLKPAFLRNSTIN
jgi:hypothetical protein